MFKIKKVVVGLSGGVDSAVAALLLKQRGYDVQAVFMQNWDIADETGICKSDEDYKDATSVCDILNISLQRVSFVKQYWNEVFSNLLIEYQSGRTPNPDVLCNKFVKFNSFFYYARDHLNADAIATGHYARSSFGSYLEHYQPNKLVKLLKAKDAIKDQTLFLCQIKQEALQRTMLPLGELTKPIVKQIAIENGLEQIARKKESMLCSINTNMLIKVKWGPGGPQFVGFLSPPSNSLSFVDIDKYIDDKPGNFIDIDNGKIVGTHDGIHHWTLGQRTKIQGVPVAYFIVKKDCETNDIYVAQGTYHPALFSNLLYTDLPYWIHSQPEELKNGDIFLCDFKFQHVESLIPCTICQTSKGLVVSLQFHRRALTPGQFAVFYKGSECLGSAKVLSAGPSIFILKLLQDNLKKKVVPNSVVNYINKQEIKEKLEV